jgi:2'-hydroxyisoflavone reductase
MNLLILGGTVFLGRHLVTAAQGRGHQLTLFNRGRTNPDLFPDIEKIHGDRSADLDKLNNRRWDAVIDTSGYLPGVVDASAKALSGRVGRYLFISTISVYSDFSRLHMDETAPVARLGRPEQVELSNETYGPLKVHCEDAVQAVYGERSLVIRPGLIVGSYDPTDRFTYWPMRIAQGGEMLAPEGAHVPIQFIDGRDLAEWCLHGVETGLSGVYNATGPATPYTLGELLTVCQEVAGTSVQLTWATAEFLADQQVIPFGDLPLWVPDESRGISTVDCRRAIAAGLAFRPTEATVRDTLVWRRSLPDAPALRAGLTAAREAELLAAWRLSK